MQILISFFYPNNNQPIFVNKIALNYKDLEIDIAKNAQDLYRETEDILKWHKKRLRLISKSRHFQLKLYRALRESMKVFQN